MAVARIGEGHQIDGRWQRTTADIGCVRLADDSSRKGRTVGEKVQLSIDTSYHGIVPGMQIAFRGWFNRIDTTGSSYGRLMARRGQHGRIYITEGNLLAVAPHVSRTPAYYASKLQGASLERLDRLKLEPQFTALCRQWWRATNDPSQGISASRIPYRAQPSC